MKQVFIPVFIIGEAEVFHEIERATICVPTPFGGLRIPNSGLHIPDPLARARRGADTRRRLLYNGKGNFRLHGTVSN